MLKRICKKVRICVCDGNDSIVQSYENVNFNSMYDVMQKVRLLEYTFKVCFKRDIQSFSIDIIKE